MAVHQCARFSAEPMRSHDQAFMRIGRYFSESKTKGMIYSRDPSKGLEVYVDTNFVGEWDLENSLDANTLYSRTSFAICYAYFPML